VPLASNPDFSTSGLPSPALIITLENWEYMAALKEKIRGIKEYTALQAQLA